ncbi:MAG: phenylacetate--CoA ligase family protein [Marinilabiliaceae bacterium]|nr:phenylacetate--CoA ligase family protein [Marinilabiliaceae bacterium]
MTIDFFNILKLKGFPVRKAKKQLHSIQSIPNIPDWQDKRKWEIFNHHFESNSFYKQYISSKPDSWEQIPIITKEELNKIDCHRPLLNIFEKRFIRQTSGSTGRPLTYSIDYYSHAFTWSLIANRYASLGLSINDKQARFYGMPRNIRSRLTERTKDLLANRYHMPIMDLSDASLKQWVEIIAKKQFSYLYGYSYPLITFAKYLNWNGLILKDYCPHLKACIVTSEMCSPAEEQLMETVFGIPCANEYGASEIGIIGFGQTNDWLISDEQLLVEIVNDKGEAVPYGESGRIICSSLFNTATPLIRYEVGDLGKIEIRNNRRYLTELIGRKEEMIYLPSGKKAPGDTTFFYIIQGFIRKYPFIIDEYRVIQHTLSSFEYQLTTKKSINRAQEQLLIQLTKTYLEKSISVSITEVTKIERTRMGKYRRFISKVNP